MRAPLWLRRSLWAGLLGAVLMLLLAACGVTSPHSASRNTSATAMTPTPTPTLSWQKRDLPSGALGWAISPLNGQDVWACVRDHSGGFTIMASQDAAVSWRAVGRFAPATPEPTWGCGLLADQHAASSLIAVLTWGAGAANTLRSISLISGDGGAHWRKLAGEVAVSDIATIAGKTYAILYDTTDTALDESSQQMVTSTDGLRTWRQVRPARLIASDSFFSFQLGPVPGELIAASYQDSVWRTVDAGASWSQIAAPAEQTNLYTWLPQINSWMLCTWTGTPLVTSCSADLGKSWQREPALSATVSCSSCGKGEGPYTDTQPCIPSLIMADGSIVAICIDRTMHRLAPHAQAWTTIGYSPTNFAALAGNQLWCFGSEQPALFVTTLSA